MAAGGSRVFNGLDEKNKKKIINTVSLVRKAACSSH